MIERSGRITGNPEVSTLVVAFRAMRSLTYRDRTVSSASLPRNRLGGEVSPTSLIDWAISEKATIRPSG
jgi:hypothetical protein